MTTIVAALPPSERLEQQKMLIQAVLKGQDVIVETTHEGLLASLPRAEILISTTFFPLRREALEKAERLRFIQVAGVGADHIDLDAARDLGISVAVVTGANTVSVAEHVVMVILAMLRHLVPMHENMRDGGWPLPLWMAQAHDLAGRTVGILGMGRIGRAVAERLLPFDVTLLYHDIVRLPEDEEDLLGATYVDMDDLLASSDILTLHLPLTRETRHILNRERLFKMKKGAYLVNAARAELVDEEALVEALQGHLAGAAIDVFSPEPPPPDHPLRKLPNVLLTPHGAGVTVEAQQRIAQGVIQNVLRYLEGHPVADLVVEGRR